MKTHTISFLAVVLAILGCVYYFDYQKMAERERMAIRQERLIAPEAKELCALVVANRSGAFRLERRGQGVDAVWWIVDPIVEQADQEAVAEGLVRVLDKARKFGNFLLPLEHYSGYGFGEDSPVVTISADGAEKQQLVLGKETPVRGQVYLRDSVTPSAGWVTGAEVQKAFERKLLEVRDKRVVTFGLDALVELRISHVAGAGIETATVAKTSGTWSVRMGEGAAAGVETGGPYRADPDVIAQVFRGLEAMPPVDTTSTGTVQRAAETPDRPRMLVELGYLGAGAGGSTATLRHTVLHLTPARSAEGAPEAGVAPYYASVEGRDLFFSVNRLLVAAFLDPLDGFRSRRVFTLDLGQIARVQIKARQGDKTASTAVVSEPGEPWRFEDADDGAVRQSKVEEYVRNSLKLRITNFRPEPPVADFADAGLAEPACRVALADSTGARREELEVGKSPAEGQYYARAIAAADGVRRESKVFVLAMPEEFLTYLRQPGFLYRPMLPFEERDVSRVEVVMRGEEDSSSATLTMQRTEDEAAPWQGWINDEAPRALPANAGDFLLAAVEEMEYLTKARRRLTPSVQRRHGLTGPTSEIRLLDREGQTISGVSFGRGVKDQSKMWVRNHEGDFLFVEKETVASFQSALDQIEALLR